MIKEAIRLAAGRECLSREIAEAAMGEIMDGRASAAQMAAFMAAMAAKGETIEEITALAAAMRRRCDRILHDADALEIVGTGGDMSNSFNISTTSALVVSSLGIPVAKHGNRAASSRCGSADVLESLGANIGAPPERSLRLLGSIGFCFLFAQDYHRSMRHAAPVRRELGIRTFFNILGPLANPAGAGMQLLGVSEEGRVEQLAHVLRNLGVKSAMVARGLDGIDEISLSAPTAVCELRGGEIKSRVIEPEQFGLSRCGKEALAGGDPAENARITLGILRGEKGPRRDSVLLNSAAAISVALPEASMADGIAMAAGAIDSGKALGQLERFARMSWEEGEGEADGNGQRG